MSTLALVRTCCAFVLVAVASVTAATASGSGEDPATPIRLSNTPALVTDAQSYAADFGVPLNEALRRLELQADIGALGEMVEGFAADSYAGHWIEHTPQYRLVVAFTAVPAGWNELISTTNLASVTEVRTVARSLATMREQVRTLRSELSDQAFNVNIDVMQNQVEVFTKDIEGLKSSAAKAHFAIPTNVRIHSVSSLLRPTTNMYAGRLVGNYALNIGCTSGFSVHDTSPDRDGLLTAGHCPNFLEWIATGEDLNFVAQIKTGPHDEQWNVPVAATLKNWAAESATEYRLITAKRGYQNQNVGDYVCKYGVSTHYGCGMIVSKYGDSCTSEDSSHIWVRSASGADLADGGDSGGPWYTGQTALGLQSCEGPIYPPDDLDGPDAFYVAISFVESGLGVTVKLAP